MKTNDSHNNENKLHTTGARIFVGSGISTILISLAGTYILLALNLCTSLVIPEGLVEISSAVLGSVLETINHNRSKENKAKHLTGGVISLPTHLRIFHFTNTLRLQENHTFLSSKTFAVAEQISVVPKQANTIPFPS